MTSHDEDLDQQAQRWIQRLPQTTRAERLLFREWILTSPAHLAAYALQRFLEPGLTAWQRHVWLFIILRVPRPSGFPMSNRYVPSRQCTRCRAAWTLYRATQQQLPASLHTSTFAELHYHYCAGCGHIEVAKMPAGRAARS